MFTQELLDEFIIDATEILDNVENILLKLDNGEDLQEYERDLKSLLHSLKGAAGMFGMHDIESWMHKLENILESKKEMVIDKSELDTFFYALDLSKAILRGEDMTPQDDKVQVSEGPSSIIKDICSTNPSMCEDKRILYIGEKVLECPKLVKQLFQVQSLIEALPIIKAQKVELIVLSEKYSKGTNLLELQEALFDYGKIETLLINKRMNYLNLLHDCLYKVFEKEEDCFLYIRNLEEPKAELQQAA